MKNSKMDSEITTKAQRLKGHKVSKNYFSFFVPFVVKNPRPSATSAVKKRFLSLCLCGENL